MAGAGWKSYSTGDLISATEFQTFIQDQVIQVYADSSARDTALGTSDAEGMFCFLKDSNTLQFYDGSSWVSFIGEGDITSIVTASTSGLAGGATSGVATLVISPNQATSATVAGSDIVLIGDADDSNNLKKTTAQDIANLAPVSLGLVLALS
tara:strand:+ start:213 stop:668 length:456 start_codon:yes stop_codon:yes gene_type:complete